MESVCASRGCLALDAPLLLATPSSVRPLIVLSAAAPQPPPLPRHPARWDPKDPTERLAACGRYISEDFGGVALHPVDVFDVSSGRALRALADSNVTTISPVVAFHPRWAWFAAIGCPTSPRGV